MLIVLGFDDSEREVGLGSEAGDALSRTADADGGTYGLPATCRRRGGLFFTEAERAKMP